jgi:ABC-2 type transport system permease protein
MISAVARPWFVGAVSAGPDRWALALHVVRSTRVGALIWGAVFGLFVIATITAFVNGFPTQKERLQLASSLQSFAILLGPPRNAETVAGFTTWRVLTAATIMGAIWGMLTSTSRLRGEEDNGRWELLLGMPLSKRAATTQVLLGLGGALAILFATCALLTILAGRLPGARFSLPGALLFAAGLSSGAGMFLAIGAVASQVSATRGQAVRLAAVVLGASYLVRMLADSRSSLGWLRWFSPLGWVEELHPLRNPQPLALVLVVVLVAGCAALTVFLAERRDLGASVLQEGSVRRHETAWTGGTLSLAARLTRPGAIGWLVGAAVLAFTMGAVARSASSILSASPAFAAALGRLGIRRATEGYLGVEFLLFATVLATLAASQIAAIRDEEAAARLDNLLVRPVSRAAWLAQRLAVSATLIVLVGLAVGLLTWLGATSQRVGIALPTLLAAGLNAAPPALVVLGVGGLVFAVRGSLGAPVAYALVAWSFLVNLLGSFLKGLDWVRQTSLFTHIALAPSAPPDWGSAAILILLGAAAATVGAFAFQQRDVEYA